MFFDEDDDISRNLFGEREIIPNSHSQWNSAPSPQYHKQSTENSSVTFSCPDAIDAMETVDPIDSVVGERRGEVQAQGLAQQEFVDAYCSNVGIHAILDGASLSYPNTTPLGGNNNVTIEKTVLYTATKETSNPLAADLLQSRVQRALPNWQPQREMINSVYCTEKGVESILVTSSLSYMTNTQNTNFIHENQRRDEYHEEDEEYLTAFGRQNEVTRRPEWKTNIYQPETLFVDPRIFTSSYSHCGLDIPDCGAIPIQPLSYEGIDDFDVFNSLTFSDAEIL